MNFRKVKKTEYELIATIHLQAFKDFFLTSLGYSFLRTYYQTCLKNNESIAVCAVDNNGKIIGFCIGCKTSKGFHRRLLFKNFIEFILPTFRIFFTNPKALFRLLGNLEKNANINDDGNYAELLSLGVSPKYESLGVGKELIRVFEAEAIINGCKKIALTTDYYNNDHVISFYKKVGYSVLYEFTTYPNRKMYKLIKEINN